jgi:hypothetical protein
MNGHHSERIEEPAVALKVSRAKSLLFVYSPLRNLPRESSFIGRKPTS